MHLPLLLACPATQGQLSNDFFHLRPGELVYPSFPFHPTPFAPATEKALRSFTSFAHPTKQGTTAAILPHPSILTADDLHLALFDALNLARRLPARPADAHVYVSRISLFILSIASASPLGSVIGREGTRYHARPLTDPADAEAVERIRHDH